jgi:hypothetical protein
MELNDKRIDVVKLKEDSEEERKTLEGKVTKAESESAKIASPRGFEEYVRTTYPVVKEGEGVIVIYDDEKSPVSVVREYMNVWEKLLVYWKSLTKKSN